MESLTHSRLPNRVSRKECDGTGNVGSGEAKAMHHDFFRVPNLSPRAEDYREIFGTFNSRASSIPVLVLPELDEPDLYLDVRSSGFCYSEFFGDFDGADFAPSYEDLFMPSVGAEAADSSSEEARTPVDAESLPEESDPCIEDPCFSIEEEDLSNGSDHMGHAPIVPECSFAADQTAPLPEIGSKRPSFSLANNCDHNMQFGKVMSEPSCASDGNGSHCKGFVTISDISLQTEPSHLPPPRRPPPLVDISRSTSNCKSVDSAGTGCDSSSFFDVEVDASSSAIAKKEVRKAPEKVKSVKQLRRSFELEERCGRRSLSSVKYDYFVEVEPKIEDEQAKKIEEKRQKVKEAGKRKEHEKKPTELYKSEIKGREVIDHESIANWVKEALQQDANDERFKEAMERDEKKKLKEDCQRSENEKRPLGAVAQEENEMKQKEDREREGKERRQRKAREREDNEKRLKETREREENEKKLREAQEEKERRPKETREEENVKRLKEAREKEKDERRLKKERERNQNERRLKKERERNQNERRLKESCEREGNERKPKGFSEREENDEKLCEARKKEENQKKVDGEREENEKRWRGAFEQEERAKKQREAKERNDNEKKFSKACEKEEIAKRAEAFWQQEINSKSLGNGFEQEESETRLEAFVQKAPKGANRWKEIESLHKDTRGRKDLTGLNKMYNQTEMDEKLELPNSTDKGKAFKDHGNVVGEPENIRKKSKAVEMESAVVDETSNTSGVKWRRESKQKVENLTVENDVELHLSEGNLKKVGEDGIGGGQKCTNRGRKKWVANGGEIDVVLEIRRNTQSPDKHECGKQRTISKDKNLSKTCVLEVKESELDQQRLQKIEEMEREREREKDRMAVDKAILEGREKAEKAIVERASAEAQQKALSEARERLEKACAEAREMALLGKASMGRTAVERPTKEARERIERSVSDNFSGISRISRMRHSSSSSDLQDLNSQSSGSFDGSRNLNSSVSIASYDAERSEVVEDESAQRCRARLERHQRMEERAAKALEEKNMRDLLAIREQEERNRLSETLDAEVKRWSSGKHGNLRALLSTLQYILGPSSGWQPIPLTDVITNAAVKKAYRKATLCIHPDKLQQRGASIQQKYICEKVFDLLKEGWNKFNSEER